MRTPDNASYNSSFTYPKGGAIEYVRALMRDLPAGTIALDERLTGIDLATRTATTTKRKLRFGHLVTSAPLAQTLAAAGIPHDASAFTWNRVLVFNLGFDKKGRDDVHWLYFPDRALSFYRVGYYDNIHRDPRMSLYVEIGLPRGGAVDVEAMKKRVLADLSREGIVRDQQLVASHSVVMDPAYVHITKRSLAEVARVTPILNAGGVHSVGRYGGWTYCSIEDNIVETQKLASVLGHVLPA
jgi:protoporphyrinogen oxidase